MWLLSVNGILCKQHWTVSIFFCSHDRQASSIYDVHSSACQFTLLRVNKVIHRLANVHSYCSFWCCMIRTSVVHTLCAFQKQRSNVATVLHQWQPRHAIAPNPNDNTLNSWLTVMLLFLAVRSQSLVSLKFFSFLGLVSILTLKNAFTAIHCRLPEANFVFHKEVKDITLMVNVFMTICSRVYQNQPSFTENITENILAYSLLWHVGLLEYSQNPIFKLYTAVV